MMNFPKHDMMTWSYPFIKPFFQDILFASIIKRIDHSNDRMEIGDIQFRIGLFIAVIVLGSAFAGGLYLLIGENDEGDAKRTADTLGRALEALSPGSSGASLRIEFRSGEGEGIRVDPTLGGELYTIHVLPSLIFIQWKEGREVVSELNGIVPAYSPWVQEDSPTPVQGLERFCNGFELRTPCTIIVDLVFVNGSGYFMVHPPYRGWTDNASIFAEFLSEGAFPAPGSSSKATLMIEGSARIDDRWLLVNGAEHGCPYPIRIPHKFEIMLPDEIDKGSITAEVRTNAMSDGNVTINRVIR
jgi:hypothetical protein